MMRLVFLPLLLFCIPTSRSSLSNVQVSDASDESLPTSNKLWKHATEVDKMTTRKLDCAPGNECRLMLVYDDFTKCKLPESWNKESFFLQSAFAAKDFDSQSNWHKELHQRIVRMYERRINDAIQQKVRAALNRFTQRAPQPKIGDNIERNTYDENSDHSYDSSMQTSVRIQTRYLRNLSMGIVVIPEGLTADEAIDLTADLPCIELASPDYVKLIPPGDDAVLLPVTADSTVAQEWKHEAPDGQHANLRTSARHSREHASDSNGLDYFEQSGAINNSSRHLPNDPLLYLQWYLSPDEPYGLHTEAVWDHLSEFPQTTVAVIDSGCDMSHPDLQGQFWTNTDEICDDGLDNDGNGYVDDCHGWDFTENDNTPFPTSKGSHGTEVSGIIAALPHNNIGVSGLFPNCKIMCLRFIANNQGRVTDEVAAIDYALGKGVKISNNSYGSYGQTEVEMKAIERAQTREHLFVAAAGNNNKDTDKPGNFFAPSTYPLDNILSVGAYNQKGEKAYFSNYGKTSVDVLAPGTNIATTSTGGTYSVVSGTSFAVPLVAAAAATIWSKYPQLRYGSVIDSIVLSCNKQNTENAKWTRCEGIFEYSRSVELAGYIANGYAFSGQSQEYSPAIASTPRIPSKEME